MLNDSARFLEVTVALYTVAHHHSMVDPSQSELGSRCNSQARTYGTSLMGQRCMSSQWSRHVESITIEQNYACLVQGQPFAMLGPLQHG